MNFKMVGLIALAAMIAVPLSAADDTKGKKRKGKRGQQNPSVQLLRQLKEVELTDDQVEKIKALGKEANAKMKTMKEEAGITLELTKKRAEAQKEYRGRDMKPKEMAEALNKAAGFSEAQVAALKSINVVRMKFHKDVVALLTDKQKENLPERLKRAANRKAGGKKGKGKKKKDAA